MPWKDPEKRRDYERRRNRLPHRVSASVAYKRKRYAEDPEYREKVKAASRAVPRHIWRARAAVRRALKRGDLVRPAVCEKCERHGVVEAAHKDYAAPLDVRWLCRSCHRRWDKAEPKSRMCGLI